MSHRCGVVAAGDPQTAEAGARALGAGGNAVDAAVAAAFAAFVCEMPLASPLGGGVMVAGNAGKLLALDFFARTPGLGGERPSQLDFCNVEVDFGATTQVFHIGRGSTAVPVALPGLLKAHERWGVLPLPVVVEPAVELGRGGYILSKSTAYVFHLLEPIVTHTAGVSVLHRDGSGLADAGARLRNPDLADTLETIAKRPSSVRDVYAALVRECGPAEGGLVTEGDVAELQVTEREPLHVTHHGWRLSTMSAPSSGGVLIALGAKLLQGTGDDAFLSPDHVRRLAITQEALLGVRDRDFDERCRDPKFVHQLLDAQSVASLRKQLSKLSAAAEAQNPLGSTTHISALDEQGMAAALTLTNGEGSGHVLTGTGMHVNNLLGEEDIHPRGFHADAPGTPLATMMAPTVLEGSDRRTIALGSGGSNRLRNAILAVVSHLVEHRVTPARAVEAPRLHLEVAGPGGVKRLAFERPGLSEAARAALVQQYPDGLAEFAERNMFFGGVHVAVREGASFAGAGDPRRGGSVQIVS